MTQKNNRAPQARDYFFIILSNVLNQWDVLQTVRKKKPLQSGFSIY